MRCSSNRRRNRATTLVELVVGMFLLATLLVALLSQFNTHRVRISTAGQRIEAADVADQILSVWLSDSKPIAVNRSGTWDRRWHWTTTLVGRQQVYSTVVNIIRLEIRDARNHTEQPLIALELVDRVEPLVEP